MEKRTGASRQVYRHGSKKIHKRNWTDRCLLFGSLLALVLLFIGLPLANFIKELAMANASTGWPSVSGEVTLTDASGLLAYTYYVNDQRYVSGRVSYGPGTLPPELLEPMTRPELLPVGTKVTVYYDPDTPSTAVLYPGNGYNLQHYALRVATALIVGVLLFTIALISYRLFRPDERGRFPGSVDNLADTVPPPHLGKGAKS